MTLNIKFIFSKMVYFTQLNNVTSKNLIKNKSYFQIKVFIMDMQARESLFYAHINLYQTMIRSGHFTE